MQRKMLIMLTLAISSLLPMVSTSAAGVDRSNYSVLWYQHSAEREALYSEVYSVALSKIKHRVAQLNLKPQQWGIILDIDETVLNNSMHFYRQDVLKSHETWPAFMDSSSSTAIPSAKAFLNVIHHMGGNINLVSNRPATKLAATEKNLHAAGIVYDQVLLDSSNTGTPFVDKNPRFNAIIHGTTPSSIGKQQILAWFGDNIQDFPHLKQAEMVLKNPSDKVYQAFGEVYYILPNPMYGSWEKA